MSLIIFRQFTHLIMAALVGVFIRNGQHFVIAQGGCERDVAQLRLKTKLTFGEAFGPAQQVVISAFLQAKRSGQFLRRAIYLPQVGVGFRPAKQHVGLVAGR